MAIACLAGIAFSAISADASDCAAAGTVKNAANAFISAAQSGRASDFASALARHTDVNALALFALGKYRGNLPAARRGEYVTNASRYMSRFLAENAERFSGTELTIESCKDDLVETSLNGGSRMLWRVNGGRIQDVRVNGVWLAMQLRQKFTSVIKRNHGYVTSLLDFLARNGTA